MSHPRFAILISLGATVLASAALMVAPPA
ncbi:MAG: hypothetical protein QOG01_4312, partial [Pseudonocardiales bacterium]|nr:hypothetical protein [Pseudonocardiales bacterium]